MLHARDPLVVASPGLVSLDPPQLAKPGQVVQRRPCPGMERSDHLFVRTCSSSLVSAVDVTTPLDANSRCRGRSRGVGQTAGWRQLAGGHDLLLRRASRRTLRNGMIMNRAMTR